MLRLASKSPLLASKPARACRRRGSSVPPRLLSRESIKWSNKSLDKRRCAHQRPRRPPADSRQYRRSPRRNSFHHLLTLAAKGFKLLWLLAPLVIIPLFSSALNFEFMNVAACAGGAPGGGRSVSAVCPFLTCFVLLVFLMYPVRLACLQTHLRSGDGNKLTVPILIVLLWPVAALRWKTRS